MQAYICIHISIYHLYIFKTCTDIFIYAHISTIENIKHIQK